MPSALGQVDVRATFILTGLYCFQRLLNILQHLLRVLSASARIKHSVDDEESPLSPDLFFPYVTSFHSAFLSPDCNCENDDDQLNLPRIVYQGIRDDQT